MKNYKLLICFLLLLIFQTGVFASNIISKRLPSGQLVIVNEMKDNPIVTVNTWVRTGSINENDSNTGVAHFLEHLFFKGSKNVPTGEFDKILESKGAQTNAATSKDFTQFYITIPSKDFDLALKMHSDMLLNPLIPQDELEKERPVVIEEISRGLDNPANVLYTNLFKLIYKDVKHPYMRPVIGTKEVISSISRDEILKFYNNWYTPYNMITVVSGDVDAKEAIKKVEEAFKQEQKTHTPVSYPNIPEIKSQISVNEEKDVAQGYMAIAFKAPKFTNAKETYALDLLAVILGGSNGSLLNLDLKEKQRLVNSVSSSYSQYLDDGLFIISSTFEPNKLQAVKQGIFSDIEKAKNDGITQEQLSRAKTILRTSTNYARESVANIAEELGFFALYYDNIKMYDDYLKKIDEVELKDVYAALNKFLIKDKCAISTVMPKGFVEVNNVAAAAKIVPNSAQLIKEKGNEKKYLLDNGATLIVRKNKNNSIVGMNIYAKGGNFLQPKAGVSYFAAQNAKRGTKKYSYQELSDFLDEKGIQLGVSSGSDAFCVSLIATKNSLNDAFYILDEVINNPVFPTEEIEKTKQNYKEKVKSLKDSPLSLALDEFNGIGYGNSPYSINSKVILNNIDLISRDDLIDYYNKIFEPSNLVIAVSGDVDDNKLIKEFNEIFTEKGQKQVQVKDFLKEQYIPNENVSKKLSNAGKETSWIIVAYKTPQIYNLKDLATLRVIDSLLGSGMSSRLFKSLREEKGLAYQVGSQINQYANDGAFFAYIGTNSKNENEAKNGILAEFEKLKTEFVQTKELQEAKDKLLGNMILALETNMDMASFLSKYELYGYDLDFLDKLKDEISNVSSSDILSFANRYFSNPHFEIIVGK